MDNMKEARERWLCTLLEIDGVRYRVYDVTAERGYTSRKELFQKVIHTSGGMRKNEKFVYAPLYDTTQYHLRLYIKEIKNDY